LTTDERHVVAFHLKPDVRDKAPQPERIVIDVKYPIDVHLDRPELDDQVTDDLNSTP
jgi:5-methylcytosine-specific restriction endonuclease McrBC regulatory subunit McrC